MDKLIGIFKKTQRWSKITGLLFLALFVLHLSGIGLVLYTSEGTANALVGKAIIGGLLCVVFFLMPGVILLRYTGKIRTAEKYSDNPLGHLEDACEQQARLFKHFGVLSILLIALVVFAVSVKFFY